MLEACAVLRALDKWGMSLQGTSLVIKSDLTVALAMLQKLGSARRFLNFIAAEIALRLEKYKVQRLVLRRVRGQLTEEANWLSRLADRGEKPRPSGLDNVPIKRMAAWTAELLASPAGASKGHFRSVEMKRLMEFKFSGLGYAQVGFPEGRARRFSTPQNSRPFGNTRFTARPIASKLLKYKTETKRMVREAPRE